jgi:hypothetical protein
MLRASWFVALLLSLSVWVQAAEEESLQGTAKIEAELDQPTEVQYLDTQLPDMVTDLELRHRLEIEIDQAAVEAATAMKVHEITITGSLRGLRLVQVLNLLLPPKGLTWTVHEGVLLITSIEKEPKYVVTRVHKVGDFAQDLEVLQGVIETTIEAPSWQAHGGTVGAIARYEDTKSLVITHTATTQRRIAELIEDLRATKSEAKK